MKNNQLDMGMSIFVAVVTEWVMPLFFILSAAGAYYALDFRDNRSYINERFRRLVIPLVFGIFVIVPLFRILKTDAMRNKVSDAAIFLKAQE